MAPTRKKKSKQPIQQAVSDGSEDDDNYRIKRERNNEVQLWIFFHILSFIKQFFSNDYQNVACSFCYFSIEPSFRTF